MLVAVVEYVHWTLDFKKCPDLQPAPCTLQPQAWILQPASMADVNSLALGLLSAADEAASALSIASTKSPARARVVRAK
jgi:hypothetical protein